MISAKSITFLRPLYRHLRRGGIVLFNVAYSRCGGDRQTFVVENEGRLVPFIWELPEQALVRWWAIEEPDWRQERPGLVPMANGELVPGAY